MNVFVVLFSIIFALQKSSITQARSIDVSLSSNLRKPTPNTCLLAKYAKQQTSKYGFLDFLQMFSESSKKYGKCPTPEEMRSQSKKLFLLF